MRSLSIQVQPELAPGLDTGRLTQVFSAVAHKHDLVKHHAFDNGIDRGPYFNYTFGTLKARELWWLIQDDIFRSQEFGYHMSCASMVMCSSETGWDDYLQLFHFDPSVPIDLNTL